MPMVVMVMVVVMVERGWGASADGDGWKNENPLAAVAVPSPLESFWPVVAGSPDVLRPSVTEATEGGNVFVGVVIVMVVMVIVVVRSIPGVVMMLRVPVSRVRMLGLVWPGFT